MRKELFQELLESVKQGGAILRGERKPSRVFKFDQPNVRSIRDHYGLSQPKFANMLGISVSTLRNWEQGRRKPEGAARILLLVASKYPEAVLEVVHQSSKSSASRPGGAFAQHKVSTKGQKRVFQRTRSAGMNLGGVQALKFSGVANGMPESARR